MLSDRELITILKSDPDEGLRLLTSAYGGLVFSVVRGVLSKSSRRDIEECVSDVFSEFYFEFESFDPEKGSVKGYLCTIAKHNALDLLRRTRPTEELPDDDSGGLLTDGSPVEEEIERKLERERLVAAVNELREPDREIVIRKYYLRQPSKAIAKKLGLTVRNVDVRTHRAIAKLREILTRGEM